MNGAARAVVAQKKTRILNVLDAYRGKGVLVVAQSRFKAKELRGGPGGGLSGADAGQPGRW